MHRDPIRVATFAGPGAEPVIRSVAWPNVPDKAALIQIGACGVCGTDLHILRGHWPKPLPWPFTLGHELGGVIVEAGAGITGDFLGRALTRGAQGAVPPPVPRRPCDYFLPYPQTAPNCAGPALYRPLIRFVPWP